MKLSLSPWSDKVSPPSSSLCRDSALSTTSAHKKNNEFVPQVPSHLARRLNNSQASLVLMAELALRELFVLSTIVYYITNRVEVTGSSVWGNHTWAALPLRLWPIALIGKRRSRGSSDHWVLL